MRLIRIANILPRGLYVESAVKVNTLLLTQNLVYIACLREQCRARSPLHMHT
jgi:hypothetical protein